SIGVISSLNRREEVTVPSLPSELMKTAVPPEEVAPKIWPMKQLLLWLTPGEPIQMTLSAVVTAPPAPAPKPMLPPPVLLLASARAPTAVLKAPVVLLKSALSPLAVLPKPP